MNIIPVSKLNQNNENINIGDIIQINIDQVLKITHITTVQHPFYQHSVSIKDTPVHAIYTTGNKEREVSGKISQLILLLTGNVV